MPSAVAAVAVVRTDRGGHQSFLFIKTDGFAGQTGFFGNVADIHFIPLDLTFAGRSMYPTAPK
ncbi:hypothetical protein D3C71_2051390 [compost metagenome]